MNFRHPLTPFLFEFRMDRLPRSWISVQAADREAHRLEKASSNPTKAEVAKLWERPVYTGPTAFRNWTPFHVKVSTTDAADMTSAAMSVNDLLMHVRRNMAFRTISIMFG